VKTQRFFAMLIATLVAALLLAAHAPFANAADSVPSIHKLPDLFQSNRVRPDVRALQSILVEKPFFLKVTTNGKSKLNGIFDRSTKNAVIKFQKAHGIRPANGQVKMNTWIKLLRARKNIDHLTTLPAPKIVRAGSTAGAITVVVKCEPGIDFVSVLDESQLDENPPSGSGSHQLSTANCINGAGTVKLSKAQKIPVGTNILQVDGYAGSDYTADTWIAVTVKKVPPRN
jgi:hypothetical protein